MNSIFRVKRRSPQAVNRISALFFMQFLLLCCVFVSSSGGYPCSTGAPPIIDGQIYSWDGAISDKGWREAVWGTRFLTPGEAEEALEQSHFALFYDKSFLYLAMVCEFSLEKGIPRSDKKHIWENESAELFLQAGEHSDVLHLLADVSGKNLLIWNGNRKTLSEVGGKIAVTVKKDTWELEVAIPLKLIGGVNVLEKNQVTFNVTRSRTTAMQKQPVLSSWAYLPKPSFMQPGCFVKLDVTSGKRESNRITAPVPDGIVIQKPKTKKRTFLYDLAEDKSMYRGKNGITEQAAPPPPSKGFIIANPIAGKPLRVLFLIETAARDVLELRERMQLECADYILFGTPYGRGNNQRAFAYHADQVEENLTGKGKKYDVIFVACPVDNKALYEAIKAQVRDGTGLVVLSPRSSGKQNDFLSDPDLQPEPQPLESFGTHPVLKNFALEGIAHVSSDPKTLSGSSGKIIRSIGFGQYGKGRIVHLADLARWTEGILPYPIYEKDFYFKQTFPEWYEQIFSLMMRGISWAGKSERKGFSGNAVRDGNVIRIPISGAAFSRQLHVRWDNRIQKITPAHFDLTGMEREITIPIPEQILRSGGIRSAALCHFVLKEKDSGKTLDWGSIAVINPSAAAIKRFKTTKRFYIPGEKPEFLVTVSNVEKGQILEVEITDEADRVIDRKTISVNKKKLRFSMELTRTLSSHLTAKIRLLDGQGNNLDLRRTEFYLPQKTVLFKDNDFRLTVLGGPLYYREYFVPSVHQLLKETGIETVVPEQWNALFHTPENIFWSKAERGKPNQRTACVFRQKEISGEIIETVTEGMETKLRFGMGALTMTDEGALSGRAGGHGVNGDAPEADFCYCPACFEAFREDCRKRYPDLKSANHQWGTSFRSWQEVKPVTLAEIRKRNDENYSLWVDYKTFMERSYLQNYLTLRKILEKEYPGIPVGLTNPSYLGQRTLLSGENYALWGPEETLQLKYYGLVNAIGTYSFRRGNAPRITWWGYMSDMDMVRAEPWWAAFNKINICSWWQMGGYANSSNPLWSANQLFTPELAHTKRSLECGKYAAPLLNGIGKMVLDLPYTPAQIAFFYSQSSMYVSGVLQKHDTYYFRSEANWRNLLMNGNWRYDYVTGDSDLAKYRVLILPYSISISPEDQEKMIAFVKRGGIILADERPGSYDEHGKKINGKLWQLFQKSDMKKTEYSGIKLYSGELGKGKLLLLGRVPAFNRQTSDLITELFNKENLIRYAWLNSREQTNYDIYSFTDGELLGIGMIGRYSEQKRSGLLEPVPAEGVLHFRKKYHVYDVKSGVYLGFRDHISKLFRPDHGEFYLLLNEKATPVTGSAAYDPERHEIKYSGTCSGKRLIRVSVKDQTGKSLDLYSGKRWSTNGSFSGTIPLGLNERNLVFTVELQDVLTKQITKTNVKISK